MRASGLWPSVIFIPHTFRFVINFIVLFWTVMSFLHALHRSRINSLTLIKCSHSFHRVDMFRQTMYSYASFNTIHTGVMSLDGVISTLYAYYSSSLMLIKLTPYVGVLLNCGTE